MLRTLAPLLRQSSVNQVQKRLLFDSATPKPKQSFFKKSLKVIFVFATVECVGSAYITYRTLEDRKYISAYLMQDSIPADRNFYRDLPNFDLLKITSEVAFSLIALKKKRDQVEPSVPTETKKRFSEDARRELLTLIKAGIFGTQKEEANRIWKELEPYAFNRNEIETRKERFKSIS